MKKKAIWYIDLLIFIGWTLIGLLNFVFFLVHATPTNLSGLIGGQASISFTFMAISAFFMLLASATVLHIAIRRAQLFERLRKSLPWCAARVILAAFAIFFITVEAIIIRMSFPGAIPKTSEIIILGAHVSQGGLSSTLRSRLAAGLEYAKLNPDVRIIVSGGQGLDEPVSEAAAMRDYLISQGLDKEQILLEDQSHNTFENLKNSIAMLPKGAEQYPVTIVTSEFHISRTAMIASRAGFKPYFIAARTPLSILPSCYSREFFGLIKSFFVDK